MFVMGQVKIPVHGALVRETLVMECLCHPVCHVVGAAVSNVAVVMAQEKKSKKQLVTFTPVFTLMIKTLDGVRDTYSV